MEKDLLQVFEQYRPMLFSIAYRMMGTVSDAEDMLQETFLRWHQSKNKRIRSPKSYLTTILTHLCLDQLRSARKRKEEYVGPWLPEPIVDLDDSDIRIAETLSMGFLLLLETLSPAERAVFLLREVFEFEYSEIAKILKKTDENCRQMLTRARKKISEGKPRFEPSEQEQERLMKEFSYASATGDLQNLLKILSEDAILISDGGGKVAAALNPIYGREKVSRFIFGIMPKLPPEIQTSLGIVNGTRAWINYIGKEPHSVVIPEFSEGRIRSIYIVSNPEKLQHLRKSNAGILPA
jgi:RNA polymerase sigma-70 factor (ECF subfamily)